MLFLTSRKVQFFEVGTYSTGYENDQNLQKTNHAYVFIDTDSTGMYYWSTWGTDSIEFVIEKFTYTFSNDTLRLHNYHNSFFNKEKGYVEYDAYDQLFIVQRLGRNSFKNILIEDGYPTSDPQIVRKIGKLK